jgi:hypothetical protein
MIARAIGVIFLGMGTILKNVLSFTGLAIGVPAVLPHRLNVNGIPVLPDLVAGNGPNFTIVATATDITVTRTASAAALVDIYVEHWHTVEDVIPKTPTPTFIGLTPFIIASGDGGSGSGAITSIEDEDVVVPGGPHSILNFTGAGVTATDAGGGQVDVTIPGGGTPQNGAMFYGTTTGTGSEGNDYAATVAVGAPVPFPRNGPTVNGHAIRSGVSTTDFVVDATGVYEVSWQVGFSEASQLQLAVNAAPVANTCTTSGAGTQQNTNTVLVALTAGDIVTVINPAGNSTALTVTPSDGALTHAQAPNLSIKLLG